ncbi:hypothetical protein BASA50_007852 [Batrachochytrium salamandrivorans]|uniref:Protein BCP1 n=1 Tax=Batrachochytrium salamandrivorans TaxID=1357716 RepID=A0ABQ8F5W6_9FUNG|nr:hypothetical protein BASA50_007852 [Batrachochytrium salamandrivorans]
MFSELPHKTSPGPLANSNASVKRQRLMTKQSESETSNQDVNDEGVKDEDIIDDGKDKDDDEEEDIINDKNDEKDKDNEEEEDEDDEEEKETIDVDFDFSDPKSIDFHGIKTLLRQTFGDEAEKVDLSSFADLIIEQRSVGSTVKADGGLDPYALLTVINMTHHSELSCVQLLKEYLLVKSKKVSETHTKLQTLLSSKNAHIGMVFNERLINMPPQLALPMFKMLAEELEWAQEEEKPFKFQHLVFIAKVYREVESTVDEELAAQNGDTDQSGSAASGSKSVLKKKKKRNQVESPLFYFQPEDELIQKYAELTIDYTLPQKHLCHIIKDMEEMLS